MADLMSLAEKWHLFSLLTPSFILVTAHFYHSYLVLLLLLLTPLLFFIPVGVFEFDKLAKGSQQVLEAIVAATAEGMQHLYYWYSQCNHLYLLQPYCLSLFELLSVVCFPSFLLFCRRWYSNVCWEVWNGWLGWFTFYFYFSIVMCAQIILYVLLVVIMWTGLISESY